MYIKSSKSVLIMLLIIHLTASVLHCTVSYINYIFTHSPKAISLTPRRVAGFNDRLICVRNVSLVGFTYVSMRSFCRLKVAGKLWIFKFERNTVLKLMQKKNNKTCNLHKLVL